MGSLLRKIERQKENIILQELTKTYGKKPKIKCPKCKKKSLYMTNENGDIFCVRCDSKVGIK